jgi:AcrR family transcriptional regulator
MTESTTGSPVVAPPPPRRADARRNRERLLAVARDAFAEHGADASLDDIARRAGVGSGTLYRHFPTRQALLEAVYRDLVDALCAQADELLASPSPGEALATWLRAVVAYATTKRGLWPLMTALGNRPEVLASCHGAMRTAGMALLTRAQQAGAVRADIEVSDLLKLVSAIAVTMERAPGSPGQTERLLALVMDGLRRQEPAAG